MKTITITPQTSLVEVTNVQTIKSDYSHSNSTNMLHGARIISVKQASLSVAMKEK